MATLDEQRYSTEYTGLISTASVAIGVMSVMLIAFETFSRLPRRLSRKLRPGRENEPASVEDYVMAYLYRPRAFLGKKRGPQQPKWPLMWIPQVVSLSQDWYLKNTGLDSAVYIRFITGCWYFMLSQLCTTLVILLPLHIIYAPENVLPSSISQASVSSLVNSTTGGRNYLWVRTVLLWWQTFCWITVVIYLGWGNIRMRREQILDPLQDAKDADKDEEADMSVPVEGIPPGTNTKGWRFRTVKVSNVPGHMRSEQALRTYFDSCLTFLKQNPSARFYEAAMPRDSTSPTGSPTMQADTPRTAVLPAHSMVDHVVIVRKLTELHELVEKRKSVLHELEAAHVRLAREVMSAVAARVRETMQRQNITELVRKKLPFKKDEKDTENLDILVEKLGQFLQIDSREAKLWQETHQQKQEGPPSQTIWEALADLPAESLDTFQPVTKLKFFRGQVAPSIDYYLTKLNLLSSLVDDLRSRPESFATCDTAFVTFSKASDARLAKRELSWIRARGLSCRVRMAPDTRDLDWNKLVESNFRGDVFRGFITHALVWFATIIWIIPMGALVGLVSLDNLSTRIPALADFLSRHQKAKSLGSSLIPTIIVALVNMLVPTIVIQVSNRGQTFVTLSKLHHATWCRYWKWVMVNVVIAFCAGTALFTSILGIFTGSSFSETANNPLNVIASSFSNGAVFFVSYTILITATQCFFELAQFLIPWCLYLGVRKASSPRQRFAKTEGRRFFSYTLGANHTLIIAIILTFSLLNPLPICFAFIYFSFAVLIFRDHFARLYWRVYYEQSGRLFYMRIMRYSLDALVLGQVVNMALFFVLRDARNGGACAALIPITVIVKLILTRWYDAHMDAADAAFADVVCRQWRQPTEEKEEMDLDPRDSHAGRKARRLALNEKLKDYSLPELSLGATMRIPLTGRGTLSAKSGPQAVLERLAKRLQSNGAYAELRDSVLARQQANMEAAHDLDAPSAEKTLEALDRSGHKPVDHSQHHHHHASDAKKQLVVPHPKLQRDDRPDFSAPYIDPFVVEPVHHFLWLPRDPLYSIDLDDTVEWNGRALVSSEGGDGKIGGWNPLDDECDDDEQEGILEEADEDQVVEIVGEPRSGEMEVEMVTMTPQRIGTEASLGLPVSPTSRRSQRTPSFGGLSSSPRRRRTRYDGSERIRIASEVANRHTPSESANPASNNLPSPQLADRSTSRGSSTPTESSGASTVSPNGTSTFSPSRALLSPGEREISSRPQRSVSVAQLQNDKVSDSLAPATAPSGLRRVSSEIIDPVEKSAERAQRRPTLVLPPAPQAAPMSPTLTNGGNRGRSASNVSGGSKMPVVSQNRALAHEVMQEEREQAEQRRKVEDKRKQSKLSHSRSRIRNIFYKAPDDQD